jgi:hypothetical protein
LRDETAPGSLRYGVVMAEGPRTIVFDVGGTIELKDILRIKKSNLTIAGQTAPGEGITIARYPTALDRAKNIVIRYVRFRVGDSELRGNGGDLDSGQADALTIVSSEQVIIDHASMSWSVDETICVTRSKNVTVQNCIIAESLHDSFHEKGPHGMATLLRGEVTDRDRRDGTGGHSFYGNLFAHHDARNPAVGGQQSLDDGQDEDDRRGLDLDFVNNVIYDWGSQNGHSVTGTNVRLNYVANYLVAGPSTSSTWRSVAMRELHSGDFLIHQAGNFLDDDLDRKHDGERIGRSAFPNYSSDEYMSEPFDFFDSTLLDAEAAYTSVLAGAGASSPRDEIDDRVVRQVRERRGEIINSQREVGGLQSIEGGEAPRDTDRDGMPDEFEQAFGLDPDNDDDRNDTDLSPAGYTNLEVYLNSLVGGPLPLVFVRGDCDSDGATCDGVGDGLAVLTWLFLGSGPPLCMSACDFDASGALELNDALYGFGSCFLGTAPRPPPYPDCEISERRSDRELGCARSPGPCN